MHAAAGVRVAWIASLAVLEDEVCPSATQVARMFGCKQGATAAISWRGIGDKILTVCSKGVMLCSKGKAVQQNCNASV